VGKQTTIVHKYTLKVPLFKRKLQDQFRSNLIADGVSTGSERNNIVLTSEQSLLFHLLKNHPFNGKNILPVERIQFFQIDAGASQS
jgi:hypothetical protein